MGKVKENAMDQIEALAIKTGKDPQEAIANWNPTINFYEYLSTLAEKDKKIEVPTTT